MIELSRPQARLAADRISRAVIREQRALTVQEAETLAALRAVADSPPPGHQAVSPPPQRPQATVARTPRKAPLSSPSLPLLVPPPFQAGDLVEFQTAGRAGLSPWRPGRFVAAKRTVKGLWFEVLEDGCVSGKTINTHAGLVRAR